MEQGVEGVVLHKPAGVGTVYYDVGDFLLTSGNHLMGRLIKFGQGNSLWGVKKAYAHWCHAAVVAEQDGTLLEALASGITRSHIDDYTGRDYYLVRIAATDTDREQIRRFLWSAYGARTRYGVATIASIVLTLAFGSRLVFGTSGTAICSGYACEALCRAGYVFPKAPSHMTPGDLAMMFDIPARS